MLADVTKLTLFVKTLNILIVTRIVIINNPQYLILSVKKKKSYQGKTICSCCEEIIISYKFPLRKLWLKYRNFNKHGFQYVSSILDVTNSLFCLKSTAGDSLSIFLQIYWSKFSLQLNFKQKLFSVSASSYCKVLLPWLSKI